MISPKVWVEWQHSQKKSTTSNEISNTFVLRIKESQ